MCIRVCIGLRIGHHFQLWESLLHTGRAPDWRRNAGDVQEERAKGDCRAGRAAGGQYTRRSLRSVNETKQKHIYVCLYIYILYIYIQMWSAPAFWQRVFDCEWRTCKMCWTFPSFLTPRCQFFSYSFIILRVCVFAFNCSRPFFSFLSIFMSALCLRFFSGESLLNPAIDPCLMIQHIQYMVYKYLHLQIEEKQYNSVKDTFQVCENAI